MKVFSGIRQIPESDRIKEFASMEPKRREDRIEWGEGLPLSICYALTTDSSIQTTPTMSQSTRLGETGSVGSLFGADTRFYMQS